MGYLSWGQQDYLGHLILLRSTCDISPAFMDTRPPGDITETFSSITFFGIASSLRDLAMWIRSLGR